jgi:pilus assembly protein Flp/PilA
MSNFISAVKTFAADENGVTAIEYGLIAALIGIAAATAAGTVGTKLTSLFEAVGDKLKTS